MNPPWFSPLAGLPEPCRVQGRRTPKSGGALCSTRLSDDFKKPYIFAYYDVCERITADFHLRWTCTDVFSWHIFIR